METKIICTLGPSSFSPSILQKMVKAGMNVVRLNFSHGSYESHSKMIDMVKMLNKKYDYAIKILQDLEGYRIRIGLLDSAVEIKRNETIRLTLDQANPKAKKIPFDYTGLLEDIPLHTELFIDDGRLRLRIMDRETDGLILKVLQGGIIQSRKGINIPDLQLSNLTISAKDQKDIEFGISNNVDYVAQSFVTTAYDIESVVKPIQSSNNSKCKIYAKIENRAGITNIDSIIQSCDGIMVARGDLGISIPVFKVPIVQKYIIHRCNRFKKSVIIATQMLESMTVSPYPTRAEVSDIANAIFDRVDFVMLSAETATGKYPIQCVGMMEKIISFTEKSTLLQPSL